ncbi:hypothetical protein GIB67_016702 [Kingdonia uniflora]|uniref:F-box domain-containing protein n=1 Tax=Kingdonia uniflora TaxID=39325 RepID=A0A7J7LM84_9MAGN|nr:hypothetical protein GIB67_016702 [Kingdonia uniflora]
MKARKWKNLHKDCLLNIFGRLGIKDLIFDVAFVCKSWYKASLDPQCLKSLNFCDVSFVKTIKPISEKYVDKYKVENFSVDKFVKFVVNRSQGFVTIVPQLEKAKWKYLECLTIAGSFRPRHVAKCQVLEIKKMFPTHEYLILVLKHLKGCVKLEFLDIGDYKCPKLSPADSKYCSRTTSTIDLPTDTEVLNLVSRIKIVVFKGSAVEELKKRYYFDDMSYLIGYVE